MWSLLLSILIFGLLLLYLKEFNGKLKLQQNINLLKPMIEMAENIQDILYYCETYPKLNYLYLSPNIGTILGESLEEHLQNPDLIFDIVHPDDYDTLMKKKLGKLDFSKPITVRFKNSVGEYLWFEECATPIYKNGKFVAVMGIFRNIDDKVKLNEQLEYNANHDSLTKLYNRAFFQRKLSEYNKNNTPIAVIIADLDDLKPVNDKYGHKMGDQLVCKAADCLNSAANEEMIVARIGGDEFAILIPNADIVKVEEYIKNVQEKLQQNHENFPISPIQISIGYKHSQSSFGVMEKLLSDADANMYQNKKMKKFKIY